MIEIYTTDQGVLRQCEDFDEGCWIHLVDPTEEELLQTKEKLGIEDLDALKAALDEEERSRLETEDGYVLVLVDTPIVEAQGKSFIYSTLPFGVILTEDYIVTVGLKETMLIKGFTEGLVRNFTTKKRNRMLLQLLNRNASLFLAYLKQIDKASNRVEDSLQLSMRNKELIQMLGLEKSLVYFSTSLKGNEVVLERLSRQSFIRNFPADEDLLEDVIIENRQAIEMCNIYRDILNGTMNAFASIISNNLNMVMKFLTAITIVISIPTFIGSVWGMNVPVPFSQNPYGFWIVCGIAVAATLTALIVMIYKKLL